MSLDKADIARLKELAEKATPGPWVYSGYESGNGNISLTVGTEKPGRDICKAYSQLGHHNCSCNAAFIAAANPAVVLALIEKIERLEKENEELRANNYGPEILNDPQALTASYFAGRMAEGREQNAREDKLLDEKERLEKEANWLADMLAGNLKIQGQRDGLRDPAGDYKSYWREAARKAVEDTND